MMPTNMSGQTAEKQFENLQEHRTALIAAAVAGKIDVMEENR